jgi:hypothetical protein
LPLPPRYVLPSGASPKLGPTPGRPGLRAPLLQAIARSAPHLPHLRRLRPIHPASAAARRESGGVARPAKKLPPSRKAAAVLRCEPRQSRGSRDGGLAPIELGRRTALMVAGQAHAEDMAHLGHPGTGAPTACPRAAPQRRAGGANTVLENALCFTAREAAHPRQAADRPRSRCGARAESMFFDEVPPPPTTPSREEHPASGPPRASARRRAAGRHAHRDPGAVLLPGAD